MARCLWRGRRKRALPPEVRPRIHRDDFQQSSRVSSLWTPTSQRCYLLPPRMLPNDVTTDSVKSKWYESIFRMHLWGPICGYKSQSGPQRHFILYFHAVMWTFLFFSMLIGRIYCICLHVWRRVLHGWHHCNFNQHCSALPPADHIWVSLHRIWRTPFWRNFATCTCKLGSEMRLNSCEMLRRLSDNW